MRVPGTLHPVSIDWDMFLDAVYASRHPIYDFESLLKNVDKHFYRYSNDLPSWTAYHSACDPRLRDFRRQARVLDSLYDDDVTAHRVLRRAQSDQEGPAISIKRTLTFLHRRIQEHEQSRLHLGYAFVSRVHWLKKGRCCTQPDPE